MTCDENEASENTTYCFWLTDTGLIPPIRVPDLPAAYAVADAVGQISALSRQLDLPRHFPRDNHCKAGGKTPPVRTLAHLHVWSPPISQYSHPGPNAMSQISLVTAKRRPALSQSRAIAHQSPQGWQRDSTPGNSLVLARRQDIISSRVIVEVPS